MDSALSKNSLEQALPPALPRPITEVGRLHIDSSVCYLGLAAPSTSLCVILWSGFVWKILCKFLETFWESSRRCTSSHHSFEFIGRESWFHFVLRLLYRRPHALCTMFYTLFYFFPLCSTPPLSKTTCTACIWCKGLDGHHQSIISRCIQAIHTMKHWL